MKRLFCAVIIAFAPCQAAATSFDQREYEMRRLVAETPIADDRQRRQLLENIERYAQKREVLLNRLLDVLASNDLRENSWTRTSSEGLNLPKKFFDENAPDSIPEPLSELYATFHNEEFNFWEKFNRSEAFAYQQGIIYSGLRLKERQRELQEKWKSIKGSDDDIDEDNEDLRNKINDVYIELHQEFMRSIDSIDSGVKNFLNNLNWVELAAALAASGSLPPPLDTIVAGLSVLAGGADALLGTADLKLEGLVRDLLTGFETEKRNILVMLRIHEDVSEFIESEGLDRSRTFAQEFYSHMSQLCGAVKAPGQSKDCAGFLDRGNKSVKDHLDRVENINNLFYKQNEGRFFGSLNAETLKAIAEPDENERWQREALELANEGRKIRERLEGYFRDAFWERPDMPDSLKEAIKSKVYYQWLEAARAAANDGKYGSHESIDKLIRARAEFLADLQSVD